MRRLRIVGKWKRKSGYKKFLNIYILLLIVGVFFALSYVYNSVLLYENNLKESVINKALIDNVSNNMFEVSKYEKKNANIKKGLKKMLKEEKIDYKKVSKESTEDTYVYNIENNKYVIGKATLKIKNSYKRMAILTINEWEVEDVKTSFENGLYNYDISIPSDYKLYINNNLVSEDDIKESGDIKGLERLTEHVSIAPSSKYEINNLVNKPEIVIKDSKGNKVNYELDKNEIVITPEFKKYETFDDLKSSLKSDIDVLKLAEDWSLFLTDDLGGSYHGYIKLKEFLIEDTYMNKMAYDWSHNIDITFVSNHRLKNPVFTNESVSNCILYNENAFSCEVFLEKNMIVNGEDRVDTMHDRLFFVYKDGYKLVNMEAIKK